LVACVHESPVKTFSTLALPVVAVKGRRLVRISTYDPNEPHFGRTASHRFGDPGKRYGTSYFGLNLATAVAESLLHDFEPVGARYQVAADEVKRRYVHTFDGNDLTLADLAGQNMIVRWRASRAGRHRELQRPGALAPGDPHAPG
jgi:hypothetical protein